MVLNSLFLDFNLQKICVSVLVEEDCIFNILICHPVMTLVLRGKKILLTLADMILQKQWKIIPYQERMLIMMESFCFTVKVTALVGY